jgi:hypothetical protein
VAADPRLFDNATDHCGSTGQGPALSRSAAIIQSCLIGAGNIAGPRGFVLGSQLHHRTAIHPCLLPAAQALEIETKEI